MLQSTFPSPSVFSAESHLQEAEGVGSDREMSPVCCKEGGLGYPSVALLGGSMMNPSHVGFHCTEAVLLLTPELEERFNQ